MLYIGSDHGGFDLKQQLIKYLQEKNVEFKDVGCYDKTSVDYPDLAQKVAEEVISNTGSKGLLICGTGIGVSLAATKVNGIRAALCHDNYTAKMAREHNDANILCIGGRVTGDEVAKDMLDIFLSTEFAGDRHQRRLDKITALEE